MSDSDTVCRCGHWYEEHGANGCAECPGCAEFTYSAVNTGEGVAMWQDAQDDAHDAAIEARA